MSVLLLQADARHIPLADESVGGLLMLIEVRQNDFMPAFGGYVAGSAKDGPTLVLLNLEALLGTVVMGDVDRAELPYFIAETIMHEIMHALEDWAGATFDEERVEAMIAAYQAAR